MQDLLVRVSGYEAPVTFPQAVGKPCPAITPDGLVDPRQIDPICREQSQVCKSETSTGNREERLNTHE